MSRTKGIYRLLILDGHRSYYTVAFKEYYRNYSIVTLYIPTYLSYILQLLDISCFSPLKKAYGRQVEGLIRVNVNYISKVEFLSAYIKVCKLSFTTSNILVGFVATSLVPYELDRVLSTLNPIVRTLSLVLLAELA